MVGQVLKFSSRPAREPFPEEMTCSPGSLGRQSIGKLRWHQESRYGVCFCGRHGGVSRHGSRNCCTVFFVSARKRNEGIGDLKFLGVGLDAISSPVSVGETM